MKIAIVNGPNLNLVGKREKSIYGSESLDAYLEALKATSSIEITLFQSNIEGELIDFLQKTEVDGFILNAGGYTHTSVALRDCVAAIAIPVVEVHLSNIASREEFRHTSLLSPVSVGCIFGFGLESYRLALNYFTNVKN
jgi:3-dehydroquinate dehydratase II